MKTITQKIAWTVSGLVIIAILALQTYVEFTKDF